MTASVVAGGVLMAFLQQVIALLQIIDFCSGHILIALVCGEQAVWV